ncbi:MAG TPA: hypothetical protein VN723_14815 [Rhizomicrobium sp.]|jgi:hypothetical protein|nr:hypothetical protein [Rhizomicrobium sp.]
MSGLSDFHHVDETPKGSKIIAWVIIALLVGGAALYVVESGMLTSSPATAGKEYPRGM